MKGETGHNNTKILSGLYLLLFNITFVAGQANKSLYEHNDDTE